MAASFARKVSRFFKKMGIVGYRKKFTMGLTDYDKQRNIYGLHPIIVSTTYIFLTLFLASVLRKIVNAVLGEGIAKYMVLEFLATVELCAACFELIIVADNWGVWTYALYLFLLTIWWGLTWDTASACPYAPLEEVLEGAMDTGCAALLVAAQVLGALVTFRYVQILWAMELVETHRDKAFESCVADLQVHMLVGAAIEAGATCLCRLCSKVLSACVPRYGGILDAFFGTMMVVAAFNLSGGYFNPALATSLKLGCEGNSFVEHMVVYWIGATVGSVISVLLFRSRFVQEHLQAAKVKSD